MNNKKAKGAADKLKDLLKKKLDPSVKVIGPAPAVIARLRGQYRWNIMLKTENPKKTNEGLKKILAAFRKPSGVLLAPDVDPISV